eukprot:scaffold10860_cov182-Amphora_coffeaeformis.AAC.19
MTVVRSVSLLLAALAATGVNSLSFLTKSPSQTGATTTSPVYTGLQSTPLVRASDQANVFVTELWKAQTPFGWGDETAVAAAMRDQLLPAVPNQKLFFIGVGTGEAAAEFAQQLGVNPALCFGDEGGAVGDVLGLEQGFRTMWNPPAVKNMMNRNDEDSLKALGEAYKGAVDNIGFQRLAPKKIQDTLRQGGTFVFRGDRLVFEHCDEKVGDNASIEDILQTISSLK